MTRGDHLCQPKVPWTFQLHEAAMNNQSHDRSPHLMYIFSNYKMVQDKRIKESKCMNN